MPIGRNPQFIDRRGQQLQRNQQSQQNLLGSIQNLVNLKQRQKEAEEQKRQFEANLTYNYTTLNKTIAANAALQEDRQAHELKLNEIGTIKDALNAGIAKFGNDPTAYMNTPEGENVLKGLLIAYGADDKTIKYWVDSVKNGMFTPQGVAALADNIYASGGIEGYPSGTTDPEKGIISLTSLLTSPNPEERRDRGMGEPLSTAKKFVGGEIPPPDLEDTTANEPTIEDTSLAQPLEPTPSEEPPVMEERTHLEPYEEYAGVSYTVPAVGMVSEEQVETIDPSLSQDIVNAAHSWYNSTYDLNDPKRQGAIDYLAAHFPREQLIDVLQQVRSYDLLKTSITEAQQKLQKTGSLIPGWQSSQTGENIIQGQIDAAYKKIETIPQTVRDIVDGTLQETVPVQVPPTINDVYDKLYEAQILRIPGDKPGVKELQGEIIDAVYQQVKDQMSTQLERFDMAKRQEILKPLLDAGQISQGAYDAGKFILNPDVDIKDVQVPSTMSFKIDLSTYQAEAIKMGIMPDVPKKTYYREVTFLAPVPEKGVEPTVNPEVNTALESIEQNAGFEPAALDQLTERVLSGDMPSFEELATLNDYGVNIPNNTLSAFQGVASGNPTPQESSLYNYILSQTVDSAGKRILYQFRKGITNADIGEGFTNASVTVRAHEAVGKFLEDINNGIYSPLTVFGMTANQESVESYADACLAAAKVDSELALAAERRSAEQKNIAATQETMLKNQMTGQTWDTQVLNTTADLYEVLTRCDLNGWKSLYEQAAIEKMNAEVANLKDVFDNAGAKAVLNQSYELYSMYMADIVAKADGNSEKAKELFANYLKDIPAFRNIMDNYHKLAAYFLNIGGVSEEAIAVPEKYTFAHALRIGSLLKYISDKANGIGGTTGYGSSLDLGGLGTGSGTEYRAINPMAFDEKELAAIESVEKDED